jgi:translocation protein SEC62
MYKMERIPEASTESPENKKAKKKWPKEVVLASAQYFNERSFYNWSFADASSSYMGYLIVGGIMTILLFPLWPDLGKIAVFYLSLYTLIFLVLAAHQLSAIFLRLALYLVIRVFGYEFWILPDIFESDSFVPVLSFQKADDALFGYLFRLVSTFSLPVLLLIGYLAFQIAQDPGVIKEYADVSQQSYHDVVSWGRLKLGVDKEEVVVKNAINYSELISEEDDGLHGAPNDTDAQSATSAEGRESQREEPEL